MRTIVTTLVLSMLFSIPLSSQWTTAVQVGAAPGQTIKSAPERLNDFYDGSDYSLRPSHQSATYSIGFSAKHSFKSGFFFNTQVMYMTSSTEYRIDAIGTSDEAFPNSSFSVNEHVLSVPLSFGADLGNFAVHSGININAILSSEDDLDNLPGLDDDSQQFYLGWHAGLKYNIGRIGLEARYIQDFRNHAPDLTYDTKELQFYGNRNRIMFLISYQFQPVTKKRTRANTRSRR